MKRTLAILASAAAFAAGTAGRPALCADLSWSAAKLPGCDSLPARMASYYQPVKAEFMAEAAQYNLPLDLSKLSNSGFESLLYTDAGSRGKLLEMLKQSGVAALGGSGHDEVSAFYKSLKTQGLPVFITSDSLLHLYHVQFDETLRDIEERRFFDDAVAISRAILDQAVKAHAATDGDIRQAAGLLAGYAAVPAVLLSRSDLSAEAAEALKEVQSWPERPDFRRQQEFMQKYEEVIEAVSGQQGGPRGPMGPGLVYRPAELKKALEQYLQAHPIQAGKGEELIPAFAAREVKAELDLIARHQGFAESPLFTYKEDYSQYVPRGHYTRSKRLGQYFKALMWYGRMTFIIRGASPDGSVKGLIPAAEARRQTQAACILAGMMDGKLSDGRTLAAAWDRLYSVTAYYVGLADDLTPYEYRDALRQAVGQAVTSSSLTDAKRFFELRKRLAGLRKPEIYGGTGRLEGPSVEIADEKTLAEALEMTQGMRLLGQRYIPDSFMMGRAVYPVVGKFTGDGQPFTLVQSQGGPIRGFPRGLDVMAVLGSARARHWLRQLGDDRYERYEQEVARLSERFGQVDQAGWNRNMYWSWLHTLQALLADVPSGYPTFMRTDAWRDKQLSAALASWSQLRHDTILYAKQSYTMVATGMPLPPKMVEGYVEPVPEFYARLLALTRMSLKGLDDLKVLDEASRGRLAALEKVIARLLELSRQELANRRLTEEDYNFIRSFGDQLTAAVAGVKQQGLETTIVADVHTDSNSGQVLQEGTGHLHWLVVVYPMPDGGLVAGVGPVLSHYEFKHPMADRLTDEAWKQMLRSGKAPDLPEWARSFTVVPPPRGAAPAGGSPRPAPVARPPR